MTVPELVAALVTEGPPGPLPPRPLVAQNVNLIQMGTDAIGAGPGDPDFLARFKAWTNSAEAKRILGFWPFTPVVPALVIYAAALTQRGIGTPTGGDIFGKGISKFREISQTLKDAKPNESEWSGEASQSYRNLLEKQEGWVGDLDEADRFMKNVLDAMAREIEKERLILGASITLLVGVAFCAYGLVCSGLISPPMAFSLMVAMAGGMATSFSLQTNPIIKRWREGDPSPQDKRKLAISCYEDAARSE